MCRPSGFLALTRASREASREALGADAWRASAEPSRGVVIHVERNRMRSVGKSWGEAGANAVA